MTSHSELPRFLVLALALGGAASCSGSGRAPPEPIGYAGPSRPPRHELVLEGRVEDPPAAQYAEDLVPAPEQSFGYADTPPPVQNAYGAEPQSAPLNAIADASAEPLYSPQAAQAEQTAAAVDVNSEGINIDAELGVAGFSDQDQANGLPPLDTLPPIDGLPLKRAQRQTQVQMQSPPPVGSHLTIAEDNPSQVVVDGIGTDAPVVVQR